MGARYRHDRRYGRGTRTIRHLIVDAFELVRFQAAQMRLAVIYIAKQPTVQTVEHETRK